MTGFLAWWAASPLHWLLVGVAALVLPWPLAGALFLATGLTKWAFKWQEHFLKRRREP